MESYWGLAVAGLLTAVSVFITASGLSRVENSLVVLQIDRP